MPGPQHPEGLSQGTSGGQEGRLGVLPVGAVCGVDGPWSVGDPVVHTGALGHRDAASLVDVIKHHP